MPKKEHVFKEIIHMKVSANKFTLFVSFPKALFASQSPLFHVDISTVVI